MWSSEPGQLRRQSVSPWCEFCLSEKLLLPMADKDKAIWSNMSVLMACTWSTSHSSQSMRPRGRESSETYILSGNGPEIYRGMCTNCSQIACTSTKCHRNTNNVGMILYVCKFELERQQNNLSNAIFHFETGTPRIGPWGLESCMGCTLAEVPLCYM